jgi:hypothetical protein
MPSSAANMRLGSHKSRHWQTDACVATRIDATPTQDSILSKMSPEKPQDTMLENRRRASGRLVTTPTQHQTKPRKASGSDMARCCQTDERRRDANRDAGIRQF